MSVPKLLCRVSEVFQSADSVVVHTDIKSIVGSGYKSGDVIELHKPSGEVVKAKSGLVRYLLDPFSKLNNPDNEPPIVFELNGILKEEVPKNTEIWLLVEHPPKQGKKYRKLEKMENNEALPSGQMPMDVRSEG